MPAEGNSAMPSRHHNTISHGFPDYLPSFDLAGLKDVDGFGELPGAPGTAAELAQDVPGLELGIGALARSPQLSVSAVGGFL
jgi:hypothetical protein